MEKAVYLVNEQYTKLFVDAICKVNLTAVSQYLQQDVCSLQYVCGKPFNKCYICAAADTRYARPQ